MKKDPRIFLDHILESIAKIETYTASVSKAQFASTPSIQDSVLRRIEIIGEAVKNLPNDFKAAHPEIPWREIAGTRDFITHEYFDVDLDLAWGIVQKDIPDIKAKLLKIRNNL